MRARMNQHSKLRRSLSLIICLFAYLCEGANVSMTGSLFPPFALTKGLSETQIGLVQGMMDIATFFGQILVGSLITPQNRKMVYSFGILLSGISVVLFGWVSREQRPKVFFTLCVSCRGTMGLGASMVFASTVPIVVKLFPKKEGLVTSAVQTALGLGGLLGAPMGSTLYNIGSAIGLNGYRMPFYLFGGIETFLFLLAIFVIPSSQRKVSESSRIDVPKNVFFKFVKTKSLIVVSIPVILIFAIIGFNDVAYAPYVERTIGVEKNLVGYVFLSMSLPYLCASPLWGLAIHKGFVNIALVYTFITGSLDQFLYFLPMIWPQLANLYYTIGVSVLNGILFSALFGSLHLVFEKIAEKNGFKHREMTRLMVANWYNTVRALGRITGAFLIGGVIQQHLKFHKTCLVHSCTILVLSVASVAELAHLGLFNRVFYTVNLEQSQTEEEIQILDLVKQPLVNPNTANNQMQKT